MVSYKKHLDIELFEGELKNHRYPWHFHDCYTLILVEKGSIFYQFQDSSYIVHSNELLVVEPFQVHRNTISQPTVYKALFVPVELIESVGQARIENRMLAQPSVIDSMVDLLRSIEFKCDQEEAANRIFQLCKFINECPVKQEKDDWLRKGSAPEINCNLTIEQLAEAAHLSKFHFQRKFKKSYGLTIGQLKQQERTIKAKILLERGKESADVAYELGFFDQSHFIKYFKRMWATTPKNFH
jgi:AraC-like DNA-binding protein